MCFQLFVNFVWKTQGKKNNWMSPFFLNTNFIWFKHKQNSDWSIQKKQLDVDLLLNKNVILYTDTTMLVYSKWSFRELIRVKRKSSDSILWKKTHPIKGSYTRGQHCLSSYVILSSNLIPCWYWTSCSHSFFIPILIIDLVIW